MELKSLFTFFFQFLKSFLFFCRALIGLFLKPSKSSSRSNINIKMSVYAREKLSCWDHDDNLIIQTLPSPFSKDTLAIMQWNQILFYTHSKSSSKSFPLKSKNPEKLVHMQWSVSDMTFFLYMEEKHCIHQYDLDGNQLQIIMLQQQNSLAFFHIRSTLSSTQDHIQQEIVYVTCNGNIVRRALHENHKHSCKELDLGKWHVSVNGMLLHDDMDRMIVSGNGNEKATITIWSLLDDHPFYELEMYFNLTSSTHDKNVMLMLSWWQWILITFLLPLLEWLVDVLPKDVHYWYTTHKREMDVLHIGTSGCLEHMALSKDASSLALVTRDGSLSIQTVNFEYIIYIFHIHIHIHY